MLSVAEIIARYYVGYYNRAPDPAGFDFWIGAYNDGISTLEIANFFSAQDETDALYPYFTDPENLSPADFINSVYQNLFNRLPDQEGFDFWLGVISSGAVSTGQMIELIIEGATTNPDLAVIENKVAAALYWESEVDNFSTFEYTEAAAASALEALQVVTDDAATITQSRASTDTFIATLGQPDGGSKDDPTDGLTDDAGDDDKSGIGRVVEVETPGFGISLATSDDVINLDDFRADARFSSIDGTGYTVAVIDTGIDFDHPTFGPDTDGNGIADRIIATRDFTSENDGTADDVQGHGTHVAGIVGGSLPGMAGVAPGVNLVGLQVLDNEEGRGFNSDIEDALQWVAANAAALNIVAVNLSLGDGSNGNTVQTSATYGDEFRRLSDDLGVTVVVAAGNDYELYQAEGASTMSRDPNTISIGAVGGEVSSGEQITDFSQRSGNIPTLFAPGDAITSAVPGGGSASFNGTSMAAPHVAGMVALGQAVAEQNLGRRLTPDEIASLLADSGRRFVDSETPNDRVQNSGAEYERVDMLAFAEAILSLSGTPTPEPLPADAIPGDISTGATVSVGGTVTSSIDYEGDQDFFEVFLAPGSYTIDLLGLPSSQGTLSDPLVSLYAASGSFITSDDDSGVGLESQLGYVVTQAGTFYIAASAYGSATGSYLLSLEGSSNFGGDIAGDASTTANLAIGSSASSEIDFGTDTDWFRVELVAGRSYTFYMDGIGLSDPYLRLYDEDGGFVTVDDDSGDGLDASITYDSVRSGTFYVEASAFSSTQVGSYSLTATQNSANSDDYAGNSTTTGILNGNNGSVSGQLEVVGDTDWFAVSLSSGTTYTFSLNGDGSADGLSDPLMRLYDRGGQLLATDDDSGPGLNSELSYTALSSETVYISAEGYADARSGGYILSSASSGAGGGDLAADTSTRGTLAPGQSLEGLIDTPSDMDWYAVNLQAGVSYQFDLTPGSSGSPINDPYLALYDNAGVFVAVDDDGGAGLNAQLVYEPTSSGLFYISAETYSLTSDEGTYIISLSATGTGGPGDLPSDPSTTGTLSDGQTVTGLIDEPGDTDWYAVNAIAGRTYQFDMVPGSGSDTINDPYLVLYDSNGNYLDFDDDDGTGLNASLVFEPESSGRVYISAGTFSASNDDGSYELSLSASGSGSGGDIPGDTSTFATLPPNNITRGELETGGDTDWFEIFLFSGETIQIDLVGAGSDPVGDPLVQLYNQSGQFLAENDDGGFELNAQLIHTATYTGAAYVSADAFNGAYTGSYDLVFSII